MSGPSPHTSAGSATSRLVALRWWWQRQGWWKWVAAVFAGLALLSAFGSVVGSPSEDDSQASQDRASTPTRASTPIRARVAAAPAITGAMTGKDGRFWSRLSPRDKALLAGYCIPGAARRAKADYSSAGEVRAIRRLRVADVVRKLDAQYGDRYNRDETIQATCDRELPELPDELQAARAQRRAEREERAARAARRRLRNFTATNALVRTLVNVRLGARVYRGEHGTDDYVARVRSVDCSDRTTCNVAYTEDISGSLLGKVLGTDDTAHVERQYFEDMAELFKTLFKDKRLRSATLVPFGPVVSPGGKHSYAAIMRMTCDRRANDQIDWHAIAYERPDGFKQLCRYEVLVDLGR